MRTPDTITHYGSEPVVQVDQDRKHFCTYSEVHFLLYLYYTNLHHFHALKQKTVTANGKEQEQPLVQKGSLSHPELNTIAASAGGVHFGDPTMLVVGLKTPWILYRIHYINVVAGRPCGRIEDWELSKLDVRYLASPGSESVTSLLLRHFLTQESLGMKPDERALFRAFTNQLEIFRKKNKIPKPH